MGRGSGGRSASASGGGGAATATRIGGEGFGGASGGIPLEVAGQGNRQQRQQQNANARGNQARKTTASGGIPGEKAQAFENKADRLAYKAFGQGPRAKAARERDLRELRTERNRIAREVHPDKGGSVALMQKVNAAYDRAKAEVERM